MNAAVDQLRAEVRRLKKEKEEKEKEEKEKEKEKEEKEKEKEKEKLVQLVQEKEKLAQKYKDAFVSAGIGKYNTSSLPCS